ncbi:hypothetical protein [Mycolicibacterium vaccae]|uniref:hypothetical protein n=1 Tax=Mycolicibacterium vaccae TaxID=1810 RepID=UPI003CFE0716
MTGEFAGGGNLGDPPWATVFDPAANARALSAIQAEGFRAASRIVDRFVRPPRPESDTAPPAGPATAMPDLEQFTRAWWSVAGQFLLGGDRSRTTELDLSSPTEQQVALESPIPGRAETVVWLHNYTDANLGRITLRCSDLLARDGSVIGAHRVFLDPGVVEMPARCSRGVAVRVEVTEAAMPGVYRGTMLVDVDDSLWMPVTLSLRPARP